MAYIKIDTDKMQTVINVLDERAEAIDMERGTINSTSEWHHDPVESVVTATESTPEFMAPACGISTMAGSASAMRYFAEELRSRRQEVIDMNESGITMDNSDGMLSYYLPDPPEGTTDLAAYWHSMDTVTNVRTYNTGAVEAARAEAVELQEALDTGTSSQGRTPEEILDQIDKHRDIPTYGAAFVDELGVEEFLNLTIDAQDRYKDVNQYGNWTATSATDEASFQRVITTLGHVLAAASQPAVNKERRGARGQAHCSPPSGPFRTLRPKRPPPPVR